MLTFRTEQIEAIARMRRSRLGNRLGTRIREQYPQQVRILGEEPLQAFARLAVERAYSYGLNSRQACLHYGMIGLSLGAFFDRDPQLPWARDTLEDPGLDAERKTDRLRLSATRYTGAITGPGNSYLQTALRQMQALAASPDLSGLTPGREVSVADLMQLLYPQKYATITPEIRAAFSAEAQRKVAEYGLTDRLTTILLVLLMFLLGSGCDRDPLYPWIRDVLGDPSPEPAARRQRLLAAFRVYLQRITDISGVGV